MHANIFLFIISFSLSFISIDAQELDLSYYLPDISYNPDIPTPKEFLGHEIGEFHVTHDKLYYYAKTLSALSDRIILTEYARSHEKRPLVYLTITSPENHARLEEIRKEHYKLTQTNQSNTVDIENMPVVLYQGCSIHGNEASGANAALAMMYYLAAAEDDRIKDLLSHAVILFDPSFNPDGLQRFSTWVNSHKGKNLISDNNSREYSEVWPGGRTNHYWFDLNRDWLLLTHPESKGRVHTFQHWKPDVLTDHHEMGTNSTFFFMPGHPDRTNPNTPGENQELTGKIGEFHARALDKIGSLYYTKEGYDDYYYGKGSTYPDAQGCVGILFEQASSRGHLQKSDYGLLSFPFAIRNQVTTMFSTQDAAIALRVELLEFKRKSFLEARKLAANNPVKAYAFGETDDPSRVARFVEILLSHKIEVNELNKDLQSGTVKLQKNKAYVVRLDQDQYRLAKTIFETVREFQDSLFYDVSAWTVPLAFDIPYLEIRENPSPYLGQTISSAPTVTGQLHETENSYAYLCDWNQSFAARLLQQLHDRDLLVSIANQAFEIQTAQGKRSFGRGTLIIPVHNNQKMSPSELHDLMNDLAIDNRVQIYASSTGNRLSDVNLGSRSHSPLNNPKPLMLIGDGVSSYDAGELWHHFDQLWDMAIPMIDTDDLGRVDLNDYGTLILASGSYSSINRYADNIKNWVRAGGNIIAIEGAIRWLQSQEIIKVDVQTGNSEKSDTRAPYEDAAADRGSRVTGGMIAEIEIDTTHPLFYGYKRNTLPVFKQGNDFYKIQSDIYNTPGRYTSRGVLSGYIHKDNYARLGGAAAVFKTSLGRGNIICLVDNPVFRGYWWGSHKLLANALFFGDTIN